MKQWVKFTPVQGGRAHDPEVAVGRRVLVSRLKRLKCVSLLQHFDADPIPEPNTEVNNRFEMRP